MSAELTRDPLLDPMYDGPYPPPQPPTDLIFDDGEPLESNRHRIAMNVLIEGIYAAWPDRDDYFAGGNMFVYYSEAQVRNRDFRGPDFFVALNVDGNKERQGWVIWQEGGRYPDVIVELMSPSTARVDLVEKKELYERTFRARHYFVYDPFDPDSLQGWQRSAQGYRELEPDERGWLWCEALGLWLGVWQGTLVRETAPWLRFYDAAGNLVLLAEERALLEQRRAEEQQRLAEEQQQRAEAQQRLAEEQQRRAVLEQQRAEEQQRLAEEQQRRAEQAEQQRNAERERAEQERQARLNAIARLLSLGLGSAEVAAALELPVALVEEVQAQQSD